MCNKCVAINNEVSSLRLYFVLCTLYSVLCTTTTYYYYHILYDGRSNNYSSNIIVTSNSKQGRRTLISNYSFYTFYDYSLNVIYTVYTLLTYIIRVNDHDADTAYVVFYKQTKY